MLQIQPKIYCNNNHIMINQNFYFVMQSKIYCNNNHIMINQKFYFIEAFKHEFIFFN
jgi:hypothetical protein